jgi:hypothetical protein
MSVVFDAATVVAAHTAVRNAWDAATGTNCSVTVCDSGGAILSVVNLTAVCGTIDAVGGTNPGRFTLTPDGRDESAIGGANPAHHVNIRDRAGVTRCTLPCATGTPTSGVCVMASLTVVAGAPFEITSLYFG